MTVRYSPRALRELDAIFSYIAHDNPQAAAGLITHIKSVLDKLERFPKMGQATDDEKGARVLVIAHTNYKVFYDIDAAGVLILRVLHGARSES